MRRDRTRTCLLLLIVLTAVFFFPLLTGHTFSTIAGHQTVVYPWRVFPNPYRDYPQSDQADLSYPWQTFISRTLRGGDFPFWNPHSFGGQPFFANGSSAVLYPPRLVASLLLPPSWVHDALAVLHVLFAGVFTFLLLREYGSGAAGALLSAVAWMFGSYTLAWLQLEVVAPVFVGLPLGVWAVHRACATGTWARLLLATTVLGVSLTSGHLPFMGLTSAVAITYGLALLTRRCAAAVHGRQWRAAVGAGARALVLTVTPFALAAVVLIPTYFTIGLSQRQSSPYEAVHTSIRVAPEVLTYLFQPPPLPISERRMHEMAFSGLITIFLAFVGAAQLRPGVVFACVVAGVTLLLALDTAVLRLAYFVLPAFSTFRPLGRLLYLLNFAVAVLAGLGLDNVLRRQAPRPATASGLRAAAREWWSSGALSPAAALAGLALLSTAVELISYGRAINPPFHPRRDDFLFPRTPLIAALEPLVAGTRMLSLTRTPSGNSWPPPTLQAAESMIFGIDAAGGYDSVIPARSLALCLVVAGQSPATALTARLGAFYTVFLVRDVRFELLPRAGVTVLVGPPDLHEDALWTPDRLAPLRLEQMYAGSDGRIFRIVGADGGPFFVRDHVAAQSAVDALRRFAAPSFDHRRVVLIEDAPGPPPGDRSNRPDPVDARVEVKDRGANTLHVRVTSREAGWLVVPESWDAGWRASVNGADAKVYRANFAFRAVQVPPGGADVLMAYRPVGFRLGLMLSLATAVLLAALAGAERWFSVVSTSNLARGLGDASGERSEGTQRLGGG